jgi:integrase/recombinase XerD
VSEKNSNAWGVVRVENRRGLSRAYLEFRHQGERYRIRKLRLFDGGRIVITSSEIAEALLAELRSQLAAGSSPLEILAPFLGDKGRFGFLPAWGRFLEAKHRQPGLGAKRLAELSSYERRGYLERIAETPAGAVRYSHLEDLRNWLSSEKHLSPKSVRHVIADLGTFFNWLKRRGEIDRAPELPVLSVPDHAPRIPSPAQLRAILAEIPLPDRGLFLARGLMGLRPLEARKSQLGDFSSSAKSLRVRGKNSKARFLPVAAEVAAWVDEFRPAGFPSEPLFPNPKTGGEWYPSSSRRAWAAACKRAGAVGGDGKPAFRENEGLRHAFATHAVNRAVGLDRVGAFLGHTSPTTTKRYAKLATETLADVLDLPSQSPAETARQNTSTRPR